MAFANIFIIDGFSVNPYLTSEQQTSVFRLAESWFGLGVSVENGTSLSQDYFDKLEEITMQINEDALKAHSLIWSHYQLQASATIEAASRWQTLTPADMVSTELSNKIANIMKTEAVQGAEIDYGITTAQLKNEIDITEIALCKVALEEAGFTFENSETRTAYGVLVSSCLGWNTANHALFSSFDSANSARSLV